MRTAGAIILAVLVGALAGWCAWLTAELRQARKDAERVQCQLWDLRHDLGQLGEGHLELQDKVAYIDDLLRLDDDTHKRGVP